MNDNNIYPQYLTTFRVSMRVVGMILQAYRFLLCRQEAMAYLAARKHTIPNSPWIIVWNEMGEKGIRLKEGQMQLTNEKKIRRASITYLVQFSFACHQCFHKHTTPFYPFGRCYSLSETAAGGWNKESRGLVNAYHVHS